MFCKILSSWPLKMPAAPLQSGEKHQHAVLAGRRAPWIKPWLCSALGEAWAVWLTGTELWRSRMRPQEASPWLKGTAQQSAHIVGGSGEESGLSCCPPALQSILSSPTWWELKSGLWSECVLSQGIASLPSAGFQFSSSPSPAMFAKLGRPLAGSLYLSALLWSTMQVRKLSSSCLASLMYMNPSVAHDPLSRDTAPLTLCFFAVAEVIRVHNASPLACSAYLLQVFSRQQSLRGTRQSVHCWCCIGISEYLSFLGICCSPPSHAYV